MKTIPCRWCGINVGSAHLSECPVGNLEQQLAETREEIERLRNGTSSNFGGIGHLIEDQIDLPRTIAIAVNEEFWNLLSGVAALRAKVAARGEGEA